MPKKQIYPTQTALAYAIMAFHTNQDRVERQTVINADGTVQSSRSLIQNWLDSETKLDNRTLKEAEEITAYLEQVLIMKKLSTQTENSFLNNIVALLSQSTVANKDLGLLAWAPKLVKDNRAKDAVNEVARYYELSSRWIGKIADRVNLEFTAIDVRFNNTMNIWSVFGRDQHGNLITYWAATENKIVRQGTIRGRVKKYLTDRYHGNAQVTVINYVKILKE